MNRTCPAQHSRGRVGTEAISWGSPGNIRLSLTSLKSSRVHFEEYVFGLNASFFMLLLYTSLTLRRHFSCSAATPQRMGHWKRRKMAVVRGHELKVPKITADVI